MRITLLLFMLLIIACKEKTIEATRPISVSTTINTDQYELIKAQDAEALLILFPGGASTAKETKREFDIVEIAKKRKVSLLLMNFNRHLWLDATETKKLSEEIELAITANDLSTDKIYIGGMSIGGTVALTLSDYLIRTNREIQPKGVFVVDSPIDLYALYESSKHDVAQKDFTEERLEEPRFIIQLLEAEFGKNDSLLSNIQKVAPVTLNNKNIENIKHLKDSKLRFYTEPDTLWWKTERQTDFEGTNAFALQKTTELLKANNWQNAELIQTENKGYRSNGDRHPHSWSIVDTTDLIDWILE